MKNIFLYIGFAAAIIGAAFLAADLYQSKGVISELRRTVAMQQATIERISGERITIEIRNEFKNTAVLGKAVTTASVENQAKQQAAIIKGELESWQWKKAPPEVKIPFATSR